jgi:hypothetical protein
VAFKIAGSLRDYRDEILIVLQAAVIVGLSLWLFREIQSNQYFGAWEKQNFQLFSATTGWIALGLAIGALSGFTALRILANKPWRERIAVPVKLPQPQLTLNRPIPSAERTLADLPNLRLAQPLYEIIDFQTMVLILAFLGQGIALWILTASIFTIPEITADSFYYITHLPFTYWWGFGATTALFFLSRQRLTGRPRTAMELSSLLLFALYTLGLPSFVYPTPRILDSYQHIGNSLGLISNSGWLTSPIWYASQFPGSFTFFAQLILVPGIDAFTLMKYYVVVESSVMVLFVYTITRSFSPTYAAPSTGAFLGALWFQLHLSPQALELVLYLGLILVLVKMIEAPQKSKRWTFIALITAPVFIVSHPETVILVIPGIVLFLVFLFLRSRSMVRELLPNVGMSLLALAAMFTIWWSTFASQARNLIESVAKGAITSLSSIAVHSARTAIPSAPSYSYRVTIDSELLISGAIWLLGVTLILVSKLRLLRREALLGGLFTVAVLTVPITVFVRTDMLARSYLFSLIPEVILFAWLLERREVFHFRTISLQPYFKGVLLIGMIALLVIIPLTRNGNDPEELIPQSSLFASNVAGGLQHNSVLLVNFGEYGYWYYSTLQGSPASPKDEQTNMSALSGGFIEANSILTKYDLNFTRADASSNYILISNYYENLYILRYGPNAPYYLNERARFENATSMNFNLVFSTGSDRIYANQQMP